MSADRSVNVLSEVRAVARETVKSTPLLRSLYRAYDIKRLEYQARDAIAKEKVHPHPCTSPDCPEHTRPVSPKATFPLTRDLTDITR